LKEEEKDRETNLLVKGGEEP